LDLKNQQRTGSGEIAKKAKGSTTGEKQQQIMPA
jgi:hypothetical protein